MLFDPLTLKPLHKKTAYTMSDGEGEFMLVVGHGSRGRAKVKKTGINTTEGMFQERSTDRPDVFDVAPARREQMSAPEAAACVKRMKAELRTHATGTTTLEGLQRALADITHTTTTTTLSCLGVGSIVASSVSRYQTALFLLMVDLLADALKDKPIMYDPIFSEADELVCETLGLAVGRENSEGKEVVSGRTVLFMPHCSRSLYANLLRVNWSVEALGALVVVGNSFPDYLLRAVSKGDRQSVAGMARLESATSCVHLPRFRPSTTAFSDTSVMWFPSDKLSAIEATVWTTPPPPPSQDHDLATKEDTEKKRKKRK